MNTVLAIALILLGLLAWGGQLFSWVRPTTAARLGLTEREDTVEPVFWADVRAEAAWDSFTLWPLVAAGVLLLADHEAWPYLGLVGGATYVYFAGRGILARLEMQRRGFRTGAPENVRIALVMLGVWGVAGATAIVAALLELI